MFDVRNCSTGKKFTTTNDELDNCLSPFTDVREGGAQG